LATGVIAVLLDLFLDTIAVRAGCWVWLLKSSVYYGIPLLNFAGWFVLTSLAPLAWILIARRQQSAREIGADESGAPFERIFAKVAKPLRKKGID
jgi:uncharacterized membrane protein